MSVPGEVLLADAAAAIRRQLSALAGSNGLDEAFVAWLIPGNHMGLTLLGPATVAANRVGAERTYKDVAILGFASGSGSLEPINTKILKALIDGLKWVIGREPFLQGLPTGACTDAVALLGIAIGASSCDEQIRRAIAEWMGRFVHTSCDMRGVSNCEKCLFATAQRCVSFKPDISIPLDSTVADVRVALRGKNLLEVENNTQIAQDEIDALKLMKSVEAESIPMTHAGLRLAAFEWIKRLAPAVTLGRPTVREVADLLRKVPGGLRLWTWESEPRTSGRAASARRWHIDNEYHVQNLLWFLLAPIFPDLRNEEYTASVGQVRPRVDLVVPSLQLIVEVKFVRAGKPFSDVIREVAEDASLYLTQSTSYIGIIPFVWDDSRRTEEHGVLIRGLCEIKGILDAVVIPRPGSMGEER
ncbi:MAG: hypothetical protein KF693_09325 [Nitrospira sp.]|nr:hypothetical protein [Nitrospira sp.]